MHTRAMQQSPRMSSLLSLPIQCAEVVCMLSKNSELGAHIPGLIHVLCMDVVRLLHMLRKVFMLQIYV